LRTTTHSSESSSPSLAFGRRWEALAPCLAALGLLCACVPQQTRPESFFELKPESQAHKAAQTRYFETADDIELLSASAAVLQDIGFQVTESAHQVGYLRATKERSARERGQSIGRFLVLLVSTGAIYFGVPPIRIPIDLHQKIEASMIVRPVNEDATRHEARIQFYRIVWKGDGSINSQYHSEYIPPGEQRMEMIRDPLIYQQFFAKLSKAVFLEAHTI
jgi:hypothetical protein